MKFACNCLKHQNNQKKYFHSFGMGQPVLEFMQRDGKMYYKILKRYIKKILWDRPLTPMDWSHALRPRPGEYVSTVEKLGV